MSNKNKKDTLKRIDQSINKLKKKDFKIFFFVIDR